MPNNKRIKGNNICRTLVTVESYFAKEDDGRVWYYWRLLDGLLSNVNPWAKVPTPYQEIPHVVVKKDWLKK